MGQKINQNAKYIIAITPIIWGINPVFMKISYLYVEPLLMNFMRLFLALIFSLTFMLASKKTSLTEIKLISKDTKRLMVYFALFQLCFSMGVQYLPAGIAGIVFGLLPVTVLIINKIIGEEKSGLKILISVGMSISGIAVVMLNGTGSSGVVISNLGIGLIFSAQVFYSLFTIESKAKVKIYNPFTVTIVALIPSTLLFFFISIRQVFAFDYLSLPAEAWGSILFSGVIAISIANAIWMWGTGIIGSTKASLYTNLNPVAALIAGYLVLGETLNTIQFAGIVVIFAAIILSQVK
jgi:drug/metabolite transporter (DMT)-like permease